MANPARRDRLSRLEGAPRDGKEMRDDGVVVDRGSSIKPEELFMYATMLVPVDGSETSNNGLAEAIRLAKSQGSKIHLVHIVNEFVFDYSFNPGLYSAEVIDSLRERGKSILAEAAARVKQEGLAVAALLLESIGGPAADLIVAKADELHADLIVMGTHGRRGMRRLALGSDAEQVLRMANVPVLMVNVASARASANKAVA